MANKMNFVMISRNREEIQNKSSELQILQSTFIKNKLNDWYLKNKDRLDELEESNSSILNCSYPMDEETEKIYKIFIHDTIKKLIE